MTGTEKSLKKILISLDKKLKNIYYSDFTLDTIQDAINLGQLNKDIKTMNLISKNEKKIKRFMRLRNASPPLSPATYQPMCLRAVRTPTNSP